MRDEKAEQAQSEFEGGSLGSIMYMESLIETTRDRCYELYELYLK